MSTSLKLRSYRNYSFRTLCLCLSDYILHMVVIQFWDMFNWGELERATQHVQWLLSISLHHSSGVPSAREGESDRAVATS